MTREIRWETKTGKQVKVTIDLQTEKTLDADGYKVAVPTCEMDVTKRGTICAVEIFPVELVKVPITAIR